MSKKLFFILTLLLFIQQPVWAIDCSCIKPETTVKLTSSYGKLAINHNKKLSEITNLAKSLNLVENGLFASGFSTANITFDIMINALGTPVSGGFCVVPTNISLFLGLDSPTIYLAKELNENTCEYNMVLRHEQTHQQINKSTLEYYLPLFKDAASQIAQNIKPVPVADVNDIKDAITELTKTYNKKMTPVINFIKKEILTEQKKLDNPENYTYENALCP